MPSGTLATAAEDRKSRLAALKTLKRKQPEPSHPSDDDDLLPPPKSPKLDSESTPTSPPPTLPDPTLTHLSGRNYDPLTRGPKLGFEAPPSASAPTTLEASAALLDAETRAQAAKDAEDDKLDLFKLQPKKPNWDLKRDLERKLAGLGVRTENAIARLVRERIKGEKAERERRGKEAGGGVQNGGMKDGEGTEVGMDGAMFVEATREREREDEEDLRRERELDEELLDGS